MKEIEIPEGYEARIEGNKVIIELKESEDEGIRKEIIEFIDWAESRGSVRNDWHQKKRPAEWIAYLEKQKDEAQRQFNLGVQAGREEVMYELEKEKKFYEMKN